VRTPGNLPLTRLPRSRRRLRRWVIGIAIVLVILIASLSSLANIYTDSLWFSSVDLHNVFSTLLWIKLGLFGSFGAIFFVVLWVNLVVCDRLSDEITSATHEDELVRRYQQIIRPYSGRVYIALAFVLALIVASGTIGEWQNWILFRHGGSFGIKDPQFHKDIGFYVFKLPFMTFVVDWTLAILIVTLVVSGIFHYLNGGIIPQRGIPRVRPAVKAHLSVLLALIALTKAAGYVLQRWSLVNAQDGYVNGAGYTDVHARLPAQLLLIVISIFAAAILLFNIRRQGWTLPILAVGIWAFVALVVGVIYPALLQTFKVNPNQGSLESPYIQRNLQATRAAYNIDHVSVKSFAADTTVTPQQVAQASETLNNIRLWDPANSITLQSFQRAQDIRSYYTFQQLGVDRYSVDGQLTPVLIGVRKIADSGLPSASWVNTHLQFTHGNGAVVALANKTRTNGNPVYAIQNVPPSSSEGLPKITQPGVYFALGDSGYVVADSKQAEVDYQKADNSNSESHYAGTGGVRLSSLFTQAAFALRMGDLNLLISGQITSHSRIMFVRDPLQMAEKAAPFLTFDHDPYAVVNDGHIDWVIDGYTTTNEYPYSQNASTQQVALGSNLPGSYNYVRNSVKVVIDAYSGKMTFYDADPSDPILRAYESAFPHMFVPLSKMSSTLQAHLRYPEDIFSIQSAIYGRYHLTNPAAFYAASDSWQLASTAGAGPQSQALAVVNTYNSQGQLVSTNPARMAPVYQVLALPGTKTQAFTITDAFQPATQSNQSSSVNYNLSAFMMGNSDPGHYGQLTVYEVPQGKTGPANADSYIQSNPTVSKDITLLDQKGSQVLLGNTLMVPVGNAMVYLRPLYVASTTNPLPQLTYVIADVGQDVVIDSSLSKTLSDVLKTSVTTSSGTGTGSNSSGTTTGTLPAAVQQDVAAALADYENALAALKAGGVNALGTYQTDITSMDQQVADAEAALKAANPATSTTTTTTPKSKSKTKDAKTTSTSTAPTSTEPKSSSTTTTLAAASGKT
jgi:uncharacterized membrane protein (UPF0182 family)